MPGRIQSHTSHNCQSEGCRRQQRGERERETNKSTKRWIEQFGNQVDMWSQLCAPRISSFYLLRTHGRRFNESAILCRHLVDLCTAANKSYACVCLMCIDGVLHIWSLQKHGQHQQQHVPNKWVESKIRNHHVCLTKHKFAIVVLLLLASSSE